MNIKNENVRLVAVQLSLGYQKLVGLIAGHGPCDDCGEDHTFTYLYRCNEVSPAEAFKE